MTDRINTDKSEFEELSSSLIKNVIVNWQEQKHFTFQEKKPIVNRSMVIAGELIFQFSVSVDSFICKGNVIPLKLTSKEFHTSTLSNNPLSDNHMKDAALIEKLLKKFDEDFYDYVLKTLLKCDETVFTTDPLWMKEYNEYQQ